MLSKVGGLVTPLLGAYAPAGAALTSGAAALGYGRRARAARMRGAGPKMASFLSGLRKASDFAKKTGLVSAGLGALGSSGLLGQKGTARAGTASSLAGALGYGRRGAGLKLAGGALRLAGNRRY